MTREQLGELAYAAFCSSTDHKTLAGYPCLSWEALDPTKREAWCAAATAIWSQVSGTGAPPSKVILDYNATPECPHCGFLWPPGYKFARCPGCQQAYEGG